MNLGNQKPQVQSFAELRAGITQQSLAQGGGKPFGFARKDESPAVTSPLRREPTLEVLPVGAVDVVAAEPVLEALSFEAEDVVAAEPMRYEKKVIDAVTGEQKVIASVDLEPTEDTSTVETDKGNFEAVLDSAYSGESPESAKEAVVRFTALLERQESNLVKIAQVAHADKKYARAYELFRSSAELQRTRGEWVIGILRMLAQGGVALNREVLATQQKMALNLRTDLEIDAARIDLRLQKNTSQTVAETAPEAVVSRETAPEIPEGPEDVAYSNLKENWKELRDAYHAKESQYHNALRDELAAQAKSWNPLKSIPYAARKMFGFNQKLSSELEAKKAEATAGAILYRDASNALVQAKRDTLTQKFEGFDSAKESVRAILARHERMLGRKLVLTRAQEQLDVMQQAPSLAEHPRMVKALAIMQQTKWARMGGIVGIAALGGLTGGIGAALVAGGISAGGIAAGVGTAAGVKAGLGGKIKSLLERAAGNASMKVGTTRMLTKAGMASYDEMIAATEQALEADAIAKKHANYTNLASVGAAFAAGGAYGSVAPVVLNTAEVPPFETPLSKPEEVSVPTQPSEPSQPTPDVVKEVAPMPAVTEPANVPVAAPQAEKIVSPIAPVATGPMRVPSMPAPVVAPSFVEAQPEASLVSAEPVAPSYAVEAPKVDEVPLQSEGLKDNVVQTEYGLPVQTESGGHLVSEPAEEVPAVPAPIEEIPLNPAIADTVKGIETFSVEKPGFLGMFTTSELQTTGGEVYATMKGYTLGDIAKIYQDPSFRAQVFANGVSPVSLERWVSWIQDHNTQETPAYTNLKLEDFVAIVHRSH